MTGVRNDNRELGKRRRLVRKIRPPGRTCPGGKAGGKDRRIGKTRRRLSRLLRESPALERRFVLLAQASPVLRFEDGSYRQARVRSVRVRALSSPAEDRASPLALEPTFHLWPLRKVIHFDKRTVLFRGTFSQRFRKRLAGRPKTLAGR
jgi:hypothetical protein